VSEDLLAAARRVADQLVRYPWEVWWFADSVGFEGLLAATEVTGHERYEHFVYGVGRGWLGRLLPRWGIFAAPGWHRFDHTAPGVALLEVALRFQDEQLLAKLEGLADWQQTRPMAGGITLLDPEYALWAWVDCMQFQGPFLTRLAAVTGNAEYRDAGLEFLFSHHDALTDESRLYSHVFDVTKQEANGIHWGRGQGWAMRGLWQTWSHLPPDEPHRGRVGEILSGHLDALVAFQLETGHWRTIVDDPEAYEETSVAAFYVSTAYPALRNGLLDESLHGVAVERAWRAVESAIDGDGRYRGVSANTHAGDLRHYRSVPRDVVVPWGQGPALLAIKERLAHVAES
jgi:unsaturated rhamnogalacturonyl hydrolase